MGFSTTETEVSSITLSFRLFLENTTQPSVLCSQDTRIYCHWIEQKNIQTWLLRVVDRTMGKRSGVFWWAERASGRITIFTHLGVCFVEGRSDLFLDQIEGQSLETVGKQICAQCEENWFDSEDWTPCCPRREAVSEWDSQGFNRTVWGAGCHRYLGTSSGF